MKIFIAIYFLTCEIATSQILDITAVTVDLGKTLPEDYDWSTDIKTGESTTGEKMHSLWKQSADIDVAWIAESWSGGSQQKVEVPKAQLRILVMRVLYLKKFKVVSGLFNQ